MSNTFRDFNFRRMRFQKHTTNMSWWMFYSPVGRFRMWLDHKVFVKINEKRLEEYRVAEQEILSGFAGMISTKIWPAYFKWTKTAGRPPETIVFSKDLFPLAIITCERYRTGVWTRDVFNPKSVCVFRMLNMDITCDSNLPKDTWELREAA